MRNYELVCIFDPQVGENRFDEMVERYENYLKANGAEVIHLDRWGLRQLAYNSSRLKKRRQGYYALYQFKAVPAAIRPLEHALRLDEEVLRFLVVRVEGEFTRVPQLAPESVISEMASSREGRNRSALTDRRDREEQRHDQEQEDRDSLAARDEVEVKEIAEEVIGDAEVSPT